MCCSLFSKALYFPDTFYLQIHLQYIRKYICQSLPGVNCRVVHLTDGLFFCSPCRFSVLSQFRSLKLYPFSKWGKSHE